MLIVTMYICTFCWTGYKKNEEREREWDVKDGGLEVKMGEIEGW